MSHVTYERIKQARKHVWFQLHTFDYNQYEMLDDPANFDLNIISPKFIAFRGGIYGFFEEKNTGLFCEEYRALFDYKHYEMLNDPANFNLYKIRGLQRWRLLLF